MSQVDVTSGRRVNRVRLIVAGLAALALVAGATVSAYAYFSSSGSAGATVQTGTLNPPTAVTASSNAGTGVVSVSWTAPIGGVAPLGYYVTRSGSAACGSSASLVLTATSCSDSSVPLGTYIYTVVAVLRSWTATSSASSAVTVAQASQAITFTSTPSSPTFGGSYTVTATGGASGQPVVFSSGSPSVCTVSGATVSFVGAGQCTINANQAGSSYYSAAPTATQLFTVAKAAQTITFTSPAPAATVGGPSYAVSATGGPSGSPVVFTIDAVSTSVCSISGAVVSFQHAGTCVIDANQAGNANYLAANQVQQSVAVNKGSQAISITSTPPSSAKVGGSYVPTATSNSGLTVAITLDATSTGCTLTSGTATFAAAGTCVIDFNQAGNADYTAAGLMQQSFAITRIAQTISNLVVPNNAVFAAGPGLVSATASSGLAVAFSSTTAPVCTVSGTTVTYVAAGTCTITADQGGNTQYLSAPQVFQSFAIAKANQTITFTPAGGTAGTSSTLSASSSSGLTAFVFSTSSVAVCSVSGTTVTYNRGGTCLINADQSGNGNYAAATASTTVTVAGATNFVVTANSSVTVGSQLAVTITAQDGSGATYAGYTGSHSIALSSTAGTSPSGAAPTLPSGPLTFASGVASVSVTLTKAETGRTVTATDGFISGTTGSITVNAGLATSMVMSNVTYPPSSPTIPTCAQGTTFTWSCAVVTGQTGNNRSITAKVTLVDQAGNTTTTTTAVSATLTAVNNVRSGSSTSTTVAAGGSTSGSFTINLDNGSSTGTFTAIATLAGNSATMNGSAT